MTAISVKTHPEQGNMLLRLYACNSGSNPLGALNDATMRVRRGAYRNKIPERG